MTSSLAEPRHAASPGRQESKIKRPPTPRRSLERARGHADGLNEHSPLISPVDHEGDGFVNAQNIAAADTEHQTTKSIWYLILLTISIGGLQIAWSVELSNGSPYLLSLGLSKSLMALVWIAGPLSGTLVQPYVGMLSDKCRIPWGKRKPFMLGGAAATIISLMFLAWTKEIVGGFLGLFGADPQSRIVKVSIIVVAVAWVYILDFAINTVQASIRAFIVDCAPTHQQETANAMASRFVGVGNIVGYMAGYVDLPSTLWFFGKTQFKDLCAIASLTLAVTVLLSCFFVKERDPRLEGPPPKDKPGVVAFFHQILTSIKRLPPQTKTVCQVQLCAWIGFFPMLFYTSSYIAEIYAEPFLEQNPDMTDKELNKLYEEATRVGTFALLIFALASLATNLFLPFFIAPTFDSQSVDNITEQGNVSAALKDYEDEESSWLDYLVIPGLTLRRAWMLSQVLFCVCMLCTVFVRTVEAATALIGLVGITWAMTLWAPWAIISAEISRREEMRRAQNPRSSRAGLDGSSSDDDDEMQFNGNEHEEEADQAGVVLGIHNMAIAAPQIFATLVSSVIFWVYQKPRGTQGDHSIAIVLALGGIMVLVSTFFIYRIQDDFGPSSGGVVAAEEGAPPTRPGHIRSKSYESLPRQSLERATLTRNKSFGGMEY